MKTTHTLLFLLFLFVHSAFAQKNCDELWSRTFSRQELEADLDLMATAIRNAHANPYTQISAEAFDKKVSGIRSQLKDGLTQREFHALVKPLFLILQDEHAGLEDFCLPDSLQRKQHMAGTPSATQDRPVPIAYQKFGKTGYLSLNTFDDNATFPFTVWKSKIDSVFQRIRQDKVRKLVIDIQHNPGGNSEIGSLLIDYFSAKSYKTYSGKWKRSLEYSTFLKSYGYVDSLYEHITPGEYYTIAPQQVRPSENPNRFRGKTCVIVGRNTFSSALMFGVLVLDNRLAVVAGETPVQGHPNHFGELIVFETPNTQLEFWFGVKEWIRPAGNIVPNQLIPEKKIELQGKTPQQIIRQL